MKLPALVATDLHVNDYVRYSVAGSRLDNCLDVLLRLFVEAAKVGAKVILFPGDLYDTPKQLLTTVVNATAQAFKGLFGAYPDIVFIAVSGNHDQGSRNLWGRSCVTALEHLATLFPANFKLIDNASIEVAPDVWVHGIPYYEFPEHFSEALTQAQQNANKPGLHYLLIHQTPDLQSDVIAPDFAVNDVRLDDFDYILCGHIHGQVQVRKNLLVVGSPLHRDLADEGLDKGFVVMDLAAPKKGWRPISLRGLYPEFYSVPYGYEQLPEYEGQYLVVGAPPMLLQEGEEETAKDFNTDLSPAELLTNFWKVQTGGEDKALLKIGLDLLLV